MSEAGGRGEAGGEEWQRFPGEKNTKAPMMHKLPYILRHDAIVVRGNKLGVDTGEVWLPKNLFECLIDVFSYCEDDEVLKGSTTSNCDSARSQCCVAFSSP